MVARPAWHVEQTVCLGPVLATQSVPLLQTCHIDDDLAWIITRLNSGGLKTPGDFCVAFCCESKNYFLLHKVGLEEQAKQLLSPPVVETKDAKPDADIAYLEAELKKAQAEMKTLSQELHSARQRLQNETSLRQKLESMAFRGAETKPKCNFEPLATPFYRQQSVESYHSEGVIDYTEEIEGPKYWSVKGAIPIGVLHPDSLIWSYSTAFDPDHVNSVRTAVSMLCSGELECESNFAVVFSETAFSQSLRFIQTIVQLEVTTCCILKATEPKHRSSSTKTSPRSAPHTPRSSSAPDSSFRCLKVCACWLLVGYRPQHG
jgi:hypothetical protein